MQNVLHTFSSAESNTETIKSQSFFGFHENYELFLLHLRHFDAFFTTFYMQNVVDTFPSAEKRPKTCKSQSLINFEENCAASLSRIRYFDV